MRPPSLQHSSPHPLLPLLLPPTPAPLLPATLPSSNTTRPWPASAPHPLPHLPLTTPRPTPSPPFPLCPLPPLHPSLSVQRLSLFWSTLLLRPDLRLPFDEFSALHVKLAKLLLSPHHFDLPHAKAAAHLDWARALPHSPPPHSMPQTAFTHTLFEVVDAWVHLDDPAQHVFLLNKLYSLLTPTPPHPSASSSPSSSPSSPSLPPTFLPLSSVPSAPFNSHPHSNQHYNHHAHLCAQLLGHPLTDASIPFTMPLLPTLSPGPVPGGVGIAVGVGEQGGWGGGVREGPTRVGVRWAFGVVGEEWRRGGLMGELPDRWEVGKVMERMREDKEAMGRKGRRSGAEEGGPVILLDGGRSSSPVRATHGGGAVVELDSGRRRNGKGSERQAFIRQV